MNGKKGFGIFAMLLLIAGLVIPITTTVVIADMEPYDILGVVLENSTTSVRAYDSNAAENGWVHIYIQNRTENGTDEERMEYWSPDDLYWNDIYGSIDLWMHGDPAVVIVDREEGTGLNRAGYVAYVRGTIDMGASLVQFSDTELRKIPIPQFDSSSTNVINISWTPLEDPQVLIAGYTIYRSLNNITWTPVWDDKDNPITVSYYNDTSVAAGTDYYYALRVCFEGWEDDNPSNITNYESMFYGEGSSLMSSVSTTQGINYILIEDLAGTEITQLWVDIGKSTPTLYARGYNGTYPTGTLVSSVEADWTVNPSALGSCDPTPDTQTVFTANYQGGAATVQAQNDTMTDTIIVNINFPTVDYIILSYSNGTEIPDNTNQTIGNPLLIHARGYNITGDTFVDLEVVQWTYTPISPPNDGDGSFDNATWNSSSFTGTDVGWVEIKGESVADPTIDDTFNLRIDWGIAPVIDYIRITDVNRNIFTTVNLLIGGQVRAYAAGFNESSGNFVNFVEVGWTIDPTTLGTIDVATGLSTNFTAGTSGGYVDVNGTSGSNPNWADNFTIYIIPPTTDYIKITDAPDGAELTHVIRSTVGSITVFASGYNNTGDTYVDVVDVTWSAVPDDLGDFTTTSGNSTKFTGGGSEGSVNITATYSGVTPAATHNFTFEMQIFSLDYINLTDAFDGNNLVDVPLDVGQQVTIYASGYNNTGGYVGPTDVDWSQSPSLGSFSVTSGSSTVFTAGMAGGTTAITGAHADVSPNPTFDIIIAPPTIDYVMIRNASNGGGGVVLTDTFTLGGDVTKTYYCAGYNRTAGYLNDVSAIWTVEGDIGTVDPAIGTLTQFEATTANSGLIKANYTGIANTTTITVDEEVDTTPPAAPTGLQVATVPEGGALRLTWNANTDDAVGYNIYRSTTNNPQDFVKINSVLITATTYLDTGLVNGTTYYYYVTAVDGATIPNESGGSATGHQTVTADEGEEPEPEDEDEFPIALLLIPIIIIIILILLFFLMKKRKPEAAPPVPEEKVEEEMPPTAEEEAPVEEEEIPPSEEEGLPPEEEELPPPEEEEIPPGEGEGLPPAEEMPPEEEGIPPPDEGPGGEEIPPSEKDSTPP
ncbi:MAG: fibronectin type III domain-containing protein [Methanomassiliicoccales archaeon]|nr:MAG: fibronectin type III domain-containing protein [Methanomassiliicoccales archaeon]